MISRCLAAILALALVAPVAAAPAEGPSRQFTPRDLFSLEAASDPQISPDGSRIAYVRRSGDIMTDRFRQTIWLIDTTSGSANHIMLTAANGSRPAINCSCR